VVPDDELEVEELVVPDDELELELDAVGAAAAVSEVLVFFADVLPALAEVAVPALRVPRAVVVTAVALGVVAVPSAVAPWETMSVITPVASTAVITSARLTRPSRRSAASRPACAWVLVARSPSSRGALTGSPGGGELRGLPGARFDMDRVSCAPVRKLSGTRVNV
jgi:hypothetical protein